MVHPMLASLALELGKKLNEPQTRAAIASGLSKRFAPADIDKHIQATVTNLNDKGLPQDARSAGLLSTAVSTAGKASSTGKAPNGLLGTAIVCEQILSDAHSSGTLHKHAHRAATVIDERLNLKGRLVTLTDKATHPNPGQIGDLVATATPSTGKAPLGTPPTIAAARAASVAQPNAPTHRAPTGPGLGG